MKFGHIIVFVLIESFILYDSINPCILLDENQWLYTSSTIAQVLATVMGLLFAGYQFYEDRLSRKVEQDNTLQDSIEEAKKIFHGKLFVLTLMIMFNVLLCITDMIFWKNKNFGIQLASHFCFNNSIFLFIISLFLIIKFILNVTNPTTIKRISDERRKDIEQKKGLTETELRRKDELEDKEVNNKYRYAAFLQEFNKLENIIVKASEKLKNENGLHICSKKTTVANGIEIIGMYHEELYGILKDANNLRRYRNYLIHGTGQKDVPQEMIDYIVDVDNTLRNRLIQKGLLKEED